MIAVWIAALALAGSGHDALVAARLACRAEMAWLDSRLAGGPDLDAQLRRGTCHARLGRVDLAKADLQAGIAGRDGAALVSALVQAGYPEDAARVRAQDALVAHALMSLKQGRGDDALTARESLVDAAAMRVDAAMAVDRGDRVAAWRAVEDGVGRWPADPHTAMAAAEITAVDRAGRPATVAAFMEPTDARMTLLNNAVRAANAGDGAACLTAVDAALPYAEAGDRPILDRLDYTCAVDAGDTARADAAMASGGWTDPPDPSFHLRHAQLLADAGRIHDALGLLDGLTLETTAARRGRDDLRIDIHMRVEDLDAALSVAMQRGASADKRGALAVALNQARRIGDAVALLDVTCVDIPAGAQRDHCLQIRQTLADWLAQTQAP